MGGGWWVMGDGCVYDSRGKLGHKDHRTPHTSILNKDLTVCIV